MRTYELVLPQDIYVKHLENVNNVKFTRREIDTIAYLLSGRSAKTISSLLSIAPKTIETHMRNIMMKLECNSRDGIIDFIEKSGKISFIKKHYSSLLVQTSFEKRLLKISKLIGAKGPTCQILYWKEEDYKTTLIRHLENHLNRAGIKATIDMREGHNFTADLVNDVKSCKSNYVLYALPEALSEQLHEKNHTKSDLSHFIQRVGQNPGCIIIHFPHPRIKNYISKELGNVEIIEFLEQENYYFFVFKVLKKLLPDLEFDEIILDFKNKYEAIYGSSEKIYFQTSLEAEDANENFVNKSSVTINKLLSLIEKREYRFFIIILFCVSVVCIGLFAYSSHKEKALTQNKELQKGMSVRSDLIVPNEFTLLNRPQLIVEMERNLNGQQPIQTIALVGIGGAGKTTMARYYARQQNTNLIWEFNAETKETLNNTFENLANTLSKTEEEKKKLRELKDIKDAQERENGIILFVREKLKNLSNWFLIFDNVEKFTDIQKYFPHDSGAWGNGKVVIVTRDNNIGNNNHINNTVKIGELNSEEKLNLFVKILSNGNSKPLTLAQKEQAQKFLNDIPPFPLDVSIAAYYLKSANVSYEKYLKHLKEYNEDFTAVQENVLREATDYTKTRYKIITLSLQRLIDTHKDFGNLLLFISLLDFQNIPRDLLNAYKDDAIVDNFIYNLKKYSLITSESPTSSSLSPTLSIHKSTQEISLEYLIKTLKLEKNNELLQEIFNTLENYIVEAIDKEDLLKLKLLVSHCERLLNHNDLLTNTIKRSIGGELGYIYFYLGNYKKSRKIIEESLAGLNKNDIKNHSRIAHILIHLGDVYRELGDYKNAMNLLEQGILIYRERFDKNHIGIAQALAYLGNVYRRLGNYEKAKELLEESLILYRKHFDKNHLGTARALAHLANVYRSLGKYEKAKDLFNESLTIYMKYFPDNHPRVAWTLAHLGNVYRDLGDYKKAESLIEHSLMIYKQHFSENHAKVGWNLSLLGDIHRKLGNYKKAKNFFERAFIVFKNHFPENDSKVAHVLMDLGDVYRSLGDGENGKNLLEKSLIIYKQHFPEKLDEIARASTYLANIYIELGNYEVARGLLEQNLKALKDYFKESHPEILRTSLCLGDVYKNLGSYEEAKTIFENCLLAYEKTYGKDHIETACILRLLGELYLLMGHMENAENFINRALLILQKNNHPEIYLSFENLKMLHLEKSKQALNKGDSLQSQELKNKANVYSNKALEVVETNFSKDTSNTERIKSRLKNMQ